MKAIAQVRKWQGKHEENVLCLVGSLSLALGITLFIQPNQIASGGTPGMAILLSHLSSLTVGSLMLAINIPLLILGGYFLGQKFVWRTVIVVTVISGLVDLLNEIVNVTAITNHPVIAAIYGGAAIGIGVGLILKGNASAGGPTIVARIIASRTLFRPGHLILAMDAIIVISSAFIFGSIGSALLSMLSVLVTGRCIDLVLGENVQHSSSIYADNSAT